VKRALTGIYGHLWPITAIHGQIYGEKSSHVRDFGGVSKANIELRWSGVARGACPAGGSAAKGSFPCSVDFSPFAGMA
jgi:hypothetical protein